MVKKFCWIQNCESKIDDKPKRNLFRMPKDKNLKSQWEKIFNQKLPDSARVCEIHFHESDINKYFETKLLDGTVHRIPREKVTLKKPAIPIQSNVARLESKNQMSLQQTPDEVNNHSKEVNGGSVQNFDSITLLKVLEDSSQSSIQEDNSSNEQIIALNKDSLETDFKEVKKNQVQENENKNFSFKKWTLQNEREAEAIELDHFAKFANKGVGDSLKEETADFENIIDKRKNEFSLLFNSSCELEIPYTMWGILIQQDPDKIILQECCKLTSVEQIPYYTKQVIINSDLSLTVIILNRLYTSLNNVNSVQEVQDCINKIVQMKICGGGPRFCQYKSAKPICAYKDYLERWRHNKCGLIVTNSSSCKRCALLDSTLRSNIYRHQTFSKSINSKSSIEKNSLRSTKNASFDTTCKKATLHNPTDVAIKKSDTLPIVKLEESILKSEENKSKISETVLQSTIENKKIIASEDKIEKHKMDEDDAMSGFEEFDENFLFKDEPFLDSNLESSYMKNFEPLKLEIVRKEQKTSKIQYECEHCAKIFIFKRQLIKHLKIHMPQEVFQCQKCSKKYLSRRRFLDHMKSHEDSRPFICGICNKGFLRKYILEVHIRGHTGERPYQCSYCGKKFIALNSLKLHTLIHETEKPEHLCFVCGKSFTLQKYLSCHLKVHSDVKTYSCSYCGKLFSRKDNLNQHVQTHIYKIEGGKQHQCDQCGKFFASKSSMNQHSVIHNNDKNFKCEVCAKVFSQPSQLRIHMRIHTGEKPYECSYCGKGFVTNDQRQKHILTHTGDRPFKCNYCYKKFTRKYYLDSHQRNHTGEKPYQCSVCLEYFRDRRSLNKHVHDPLQKIN